MCICLSSRLIANRSVWLDRYSRAVGLAVRSPDPWIRYARMVSAEDVSRQAWWGPHSHVHPYVPGDYYRPTADTAGMDEALYFDLTSFLPGDILVKVDRAAMAHGLETRAPFLDRDLVEFALSLPSVLKVRDGETKVLFKQAFSRYWPREIQTRGKQGFAGPFQAWLGLPDVAASTRRIFAKGSALRSLLPGLQPEQQHVRNYRTWDLLTLGLWLEHHSIEA